LRTIFETAVSLHRFYLSNVVNEKSADLFSNVYKAMLGRKHLRN